MDWYRWTHTFAKYRLAIQVSLVELMRICVCIGVPPGATTTVEGFNETVIGTMGTEPPPPPPHPLAAPATIPNMTAHNRGDVRGTRMGLTRQNRIDYRTCAK
jgi:hypothetical protein